jgi:hypothetical protein
MSQEKVPFIHGLCEGFAKGAVPSVLEQLDQSIEWMRPKTTSMRIATPTPDRRRARGECSRSWGLTQPAPATDGGSVVLIT